MISNDITNDITGWTFIKLKQYFCNVQKFIIHLLFQLWNCYS